MSVQPTYEDSLKKIASLEQQVTQMSQLVAAKKDTDEEEDKEMEAKYKKAQTEMDDEDKKHDAAMDEMHKIKEAFKRAEDETDPEKKKEAMKKAIDKKEDYDVKHSKKAQRTEPAPIDEKKDKDMEAKVANTIMKKVPLINKILEATKMIDPQNYSKVEKELTAATLEEVEAKYAFIAPYMAATGMSNSTQTPSPQRTMIPFQAGVALNDNNPTDIHSASVDSIDFGKVKTSEIMGMYN
jgi:hypothetical protein